MIPIIILVKNHLNLTLASIGSSQRTHQFPDQTNGHGRGSGGNPFSLDSWKSWAHPHENHLGSC